MNRLVINLEALHHNIRLVDGWLQSHGASWTLVTKVLCGHADTLRALQLLGVRSMADSRIRNLEAIDRIIPGFESWYLRLPNMSEIDQICRLSDVSLNSELEIIKALNDAAGRLDQVHRIIIMIELGDLREGILPGSLVNFYRNAFSLPNIDVLGIGANLGCMAGTVPNIDQLTQLVLYRELLELKFERRLPLISAGSSVVLPLLLEGRVPRAVNHFRIGEAVFLGTDLVNGGILPDLRDDAFTLHAEILEIKEKSLIPPGDTASTTPFEPIGDEEYSPAQRGFRAVLSVGQLDTDVAGLRPTDPDIRLAGASSDVMVVNLGENDHDLKVGDDIRFRPSYGALVRLMISRYIEKTVVPNIEKFSSRLKDNTLVEIEPVLRDDQAGTCE